MIEHLCELIVTVTRHSCYVKYGLTQKYVRKFLTGSGERERERQREYESPLGFCYAKVVSIKY